MRVSMHLMDGLVGWTWLGWLDWAGYASIKQCLYFDPSSYSISGTMEDLAHTSPCIYTYI